MGACGVRPSARWEKRVASVTWPDAPAWRRNLGCYGSLLAMQVKTVLARPWAFIVEFVLVAAYDLGMAAAWLWFFKVFGVVKGWEGRDYIGAFGISMLVFGIGMMFSAGVTQLPRLVDDGALDHMFTKPVPMLIQLAAYRFDSTAITDTVMGAAVICWYVLTEPITLAEAGVAMVAIGVALVIYWCFAILLPNLLPFYMRGSDRL